jgi:hypothetical protein
MEKNPNIKNTTDLFKALDIKKNFLTKEQIFFLNKNGYIFFKPSEIMKSKIKKISLISNKLIKKEKDKGGWEGKEKHYKKGKFFENGANRLGNLINKNAIYRDLILTPEILASAYSVIKGDFKVGGVDLRNPLKGKGFQRLHIDWLPRKKKKEKYIGVVCFIFVDDMNSKNGPLRIIPGSHKKMGWPDETIDVYKHNKKEVKIFGKAGSICIMNLNLWHGGSNNFSGKPRKTILIDIRRRDQAQLLNFKKYLDSSLKEKLTNSHKYLLSIRNIDKNQKIDSFGPGDTYRKIINGKKNN